MNSEATSPDTGSPERFSYDSATGLRRSPEWDPAIRDDDGLMATADPALLRPSDWATIGDTITAFMAATFAEASEWGAELSLTINAPPVAGVPLDFIEVDLDGRFPWHATNATFMAPSGAVDDIAESFLRDAGWQGVGTGGPVYKVWDDVSLVDVAAQITAAAVAVFPPKRVGAWEVSVTVLEPEDETETSYEVVAGATRAVLARTVSEVMATSANAVEGQDWDGACRALGFDPGELGPLRRDATR